MRSSRSGPSRGSRYSTSTARGRGGITKRRGASGKVDRDGDLVMDAVVGEGTRGNRGGPSNRRAQSIHRALTSSVTQNARVHSAKSRGGHQKDGESKGQADTGDRVYLQVYGVKKSNVAGNQDGGVEGLRTWLERRVSSIPPRGRHLRIQEIYLDGDYVILSVSADDSRRLLTLDGQRFAGTDVTIQEMQTGGSKPSGNTSEQAQVLKNRLREILAARYDPTSKLLNLSALGKDQGLIDLGMFEVQGRVSKLFPVLMAVCEQVYPSADEKRRSIDSITLADNELDNLSNVTSLAQTFPDLINLDLSRNRFSDLRSLEAWRWKFRKLQNLILSGNPLEGTDPSYAQEIMRWYPELLTLNNVVVRTPDQVQAAVETAKKAKDAAHVSPIPIKAPDIRDVDRVGETFLSQFFRLYDTDRANLARTLYDSDSVHSLSVNTSAPRSHHQATQQAWVAYIKHSRNLIRATNQSTRIARLYRGSENISTLWAELPATKHPDIPSELSKYLIECHPLSGLPDPSGQNPIGVTGLILMVHGEFIEDNEALGRPCQRSFSRTFILGPSITPNQPFRVINDIVVLRAWSPLTSVTGQVIDQIPSGDLTATYKNEILGQLVARTKMTTEYATMCLDESGWQLEPALAAFNKQKAHLPKEAFIS